MPAGKKLGKQLGRVNLVTPLNEIKWEFLCGECESVCLWEKSLQQLFKCMPHDKYEG